MDNIGKVIPCRHKQRPFLSVVRAYFVDPAQDERASSKSDITEPIHDLSTVDVVVERHLAKNDAEDQLPSMSAHGLFKETLTPDRSRTYVYKGARIDERETSTSKRAVGKPPPYERHANKYADCHIRHCTVSLVQVDTGVPRKTHDS